MSKLYILQKVLLRKEIDMMVSMSTSSEPSALNDDVFKFTKYAVDAPIPEVKVKYEKMLEVLGATDIASLKFETFRARFEENSYIRPTKLADFDEDFKYIFLTKENESKDISGGRFMIFSDDGYRGSPLIEKGGTICFNSNTRYEISRLLAGTADYIITYVK